MKTDIDTKKIGFIGAGKTGFCLGKYFSKIDSDDYEVCGYFSRDPESAREAAAFAGGRAFETAEELAGECDLLLLTVPDGQIEGVWEQLLAGLKPSRPLLVGHCSGCLDSRVFHGEAGSAYAFGSLHPLFALHDKETAYNGLYRAYFSIEGDKAFLDFASALLTELGNPYSEIKAENKILYHAASVMVSNLVNALAYEGMKLFDECGFDRGFSEYAWRLLFIENAGNAANLSPVRALTGPVERADLETVEKHLNALSGDTREIYRLLSLKLTEVAQIKNPERDYGELRKILCK